MTQSNSDRAQQKETKFRKVEEGGIEAIIHLHEITYSRAYENTGRSFNRDYLRAALKKAEKDDITIVAEDEGKIVAFTWGGAVPGITGATPSERPRYCSCIQTTRTGGWVQN